LRDDNGDGKNVQGAEERTITRTIVAYKFQK